MIVGCLFAMLIATLPRVALIFAWLFSARWSQVWTGWFWPLMGFLFAPYTTIMYMLTWTSVSGIHGWDWMWVGMGVMLDAMKWAQIFVQRREVPGYPAYAP